MPLLTMIYPRGKGIDAFSPQSVGHCVRVAEELGSDMIKTNYPGNPAAFKKILDIWATELPMVTFLGEQPRSLSSRAALRGIPPGMPNDDTTGDEHFCQDETYYWDDPSKHTG
jgi:fructose-bisphosphate aldolase/2-amino-3,7-dideoxy-D-threo-hept-6-ulosonate synthase